MGEDGEEAIDLRNFLGFLNQRFNNEFLNISTMMQLTPLEVGMLFGRKDHELILSRQSLLERVTKHQQ